MPPELIASLPQLAALVEKLGVVGVLLIAVGWLVYERLRLVKELGRTYRQRDRWRLAAVKYKTVTDTAGLKVDLSDLSDLFEEAQ